MSKKRGLSLEEKREQMLQIFYESQEFFLLKELEKMGPKKGVISQSVKDVVQSLVDDDLVLKDKIGTSVYFWSLPSCAGNQLRNTYNKLESDLSNSRKRYMDLVEHRDNLKRGREDSEEREAALEELKTVELHHKKLKEELAAYADSDPAAVEAMSMRWPLYTTLRMLLILLIQQLTGGQVIFLLMNSPRYMSNCCHSKATLNIFNNIPDNIFTLQQWCSTTFPEAKEQLEHMYREVGITEDFEYLQ
uniref:Meiotic nuclear division protein 1 homolog n=1 Tax=Zea mays TaxID=4577 RepID=A0A804ML23_MAIZE